MSVPHVSVIIPVHNNAATLDELVKRILDGFRGGGRPCEVILVDDGSTDGSWAGILRLCSENPAARGIRLDRNYGQHAAIWAGIENSQGDHLVFIDADLQYDPDDLPRMSEILEVGHDFVSGVRGGESARYGMLRRVSSRLYNLLAGFLTGVHLRDYGCPVNAAARSLADRVRQCGSRRRFIKPMAVSLAEKPVELEIRHRLRPHGKSSYTLSKLLRFGFGFMLGFSRKPFFLSVRVGSLLLLAGLLSIPLRAGLFGSIVGVLGAVFLALGLVGDVVRRRYIAGKGRPMYVIEEMVGPEFPGPVESP